LILGDRSILNGTTALTLDSPLGVGLAVALGCGLLIGVERERRKGQQGHRATAGLRTFTIAALAGALAQGMGQTWLVAMGGLLVVALVVIGYWRDRTDDPGITTELALFATYVLGVTAVDHPQVASATAVIVAILLAARARLHQFSTDILTSQELHSALVLASSALVVMPLIPDRPLPFLSQVNPRDLWRLTVMLMALQAAGHVGLRLVGPRLGLAVTGLISGFISSTATIAAMGARARQEPDQASACLTGALASNLSTMLLMVVIAATATPTLIPVVLMPLAASFMVMVILTVLSLRRQGLLKPTATTDEQVFGLHQTLAFAVLLSVVTASVAWLTDHAPAGAQYVGVALAAFADVHAASAAVFALCANHKIAPAQTVFPMLLALSTNSLSKMVAAWIGGGVRFGVLMSAALSGMVAAAWGVWWLGH
jgi:uncharacterized membrane protein (DUF4010 family)